MPKRTVPAKSYRFASARAARSAGTLFERYDGWPDGVISPIWVNENVIDITTTPSAVGEPAAVDWRPKTAAYTVVSEVTTVAGEGTPLQLDSPTPGVIRVRGQIAATSPPTLSIWHVEDPAAFARTAFIEALERAGVAVRADATDENPRGLLPSETTYPTAQLVGQRVSAPLSEYTKVILKTSYNRGADLMVSLLAVRDGSTNPTDGLTRELAIITELGVRPESTILFDGAGSDERDRTSPGDITRFLIGISRRPSGAAFRNGLAILGVDGDIATLQQGTPSAGKVRAKTGSRAGVTPNERQGIITALTMGGYIEAASGRQIVFAIFLRDLSFSTLDEFLAAREDQATIAAAIRQGY